jgi:ubiquinone/menaquinone biosynthesis C-methylase UbiE
MRDDTSSETTYTIGYGGEAHALMSRRSAGNEAGFVLPHLRPGMRVLDCGSGPGTITLGLAEAVAPAEVVGIDLSPTQVERARALATERGAENVRFEVGNVYELPFADGSFDVVFANAVLMHLRDPVAALREWRRVVRSGGMVAARDHGVRLSEPRTSAIERLDELFSKVAQVTIGRPNPAIGMRHRQLLLEAGFHRAEGFADVTFRGDPVALRRHAAFIRSLLESDEFRQITSSLGITDDELDQLADDVDAWYDRPDAVVAPVWSAGIGWVD